MIIIHSVNNYLNRCIEPNLQRHLDLMPVVVVTGSRKSGKSTLALNATESTRRYETLDDFEILAFLTDDPLGFLNTREIFTLDEVQRRPDVLLAIKRIIDKKRLNGQFLLTGSANLLLLEKMGESIAGLASYLTLWPMTLREQAGLGKCGIWSELVNSSDQDWLDVLDQHSPNVNRSPTDADWRKYVCNGGYPTPALAMNSNEQRAIWFEGYIRTYLERDVLQLSNISNLLDFRRLITMLSQRVGQIVNQSGLSRITGISQPTINRYLNLLEVSYQVVRLPAFSVNRTKRLIKSPKLYWSDTGLALYLGNIEPTGFHFENLVLQDLLVWRDSTPNRSQLFHWRTTTGTEIDFMVETKAGLLPIEVKATENPRARDTVGLSAFANEYRGDARAGILIHAGSRTSWLSRNVLAVPWWRIVYPELIT